jgi:hypothetical protein
MVTKVKCARGISEGNWNSEWTIWTIVSHHCNIHHSTSKHSVVMFALIVSWPSTLACDIKRVRHVLTLVHLSRISYTLKMEAMRSSETSVNKISTRRHIPENCFLHGIHRIVFPWKRQFEIQCEALSFIPSFHLPFLFFFFAVLFTLLLLPS